MVITIINELSQSSWSRIDILVVRSAMQFPLIAHTAKQDWLQLLAA